METKAIDYGGYILSPILPGRHPVARPQRLISNSRLGGASRRRFFSIPSLLQLVQVHKHLHTHPTEHSPLKQNKLHLPHIDCLKEKIPPLLAHNFDLARSPPASLLLVIPPKSQDYKLLYRTISSPPLWLTPARREMWI